MSDIKTQLKNFCEEKRYILRFYFKNLRSGEETGREENIITSSASVRKIAILMAALKSVNDNKIKLSDKIKIDKKFQKNRSGILRYLVSGFELSFENLLLLMIIISDNTATGHVVDIIGLDHINEYNKSIGLINTNVKAGFPPKGKEHLPEHTDTTTAKEIGLLLEMILQGSNDEKVAEKLGSTTELCSLALNFLKKQMYNTKIPYLLPKKYIIVAHKTGTRSNQGVFNDAGIVFHKDEPLYILTVFSSKGEDYLPDKSEVVFDIAKLSKMCFDHVVSDKS